MEQYRITSADFFTPGDTGEPDAIMDPSDLAAIKSIANPFAAKVWAHAIQPKTTPSVIKEQKYDVETTGRNRIS